LNFDLSTWFEDIPGKSERREGEVGDKEENGERFLKSNSYFEAYSKELYTMGGILQR